MTRKCQIIQTQYWENARASGLTKNELLVEFFLMTWRDCGASGIFIGAPSTIAYYTGLEEVNRDIMLDGEVTSVLKKLSEKGRVKIYEGNWIWITGKYEYESSKTIQVQKSVISDLQSCPKTLRGDWLGRYGEDIDPTLVSTLNVTLNGKLGATLPSREKVKEKVKRKEKVKEYTPEIKKFITGWFDKLSEKEFLAQCDAVEKLYRLDGFPLQEIFSILNWVKNGEGEAASFWRSKTSSFIPLRETRKGRRCNKYHNMKLAYGEHSQSSKKRTKTIDDDSKFKTEGVQDL